MRSAAHLILVPASLLIAAALGCGWQSRATNPPDRLSRASADSECTAEPRVAEPTEEEINTPVRASEGPECVAYFRGLRRLYDSLRVCASSADCVMVNEPPVLPYVLDLGMAVVAGKDAREKLLQYRRTRPPCMAMHIRAAPVYEPICIAGRCEACAGACCEKGVIRPEPAWMERDRRAEQRERSKPP